MRVIGTAGHVDHGKSTLVHCLTDIDPDRLAEEKARAMTIDLGFAWLTLPNEETIGIVDVPGHRDFIENMLAGVGGIDAVILVIAADEGVMPQTREHLAILDLLGIEKGIIALTKVDLVNDNDWLDLVEQEVLEFAEGTTLDGAPIVRISAHTGDGIEELVSCLTDLFDTLSRKNNYNHPRLAIDRVFTIHGFGTVVTGTLLGGTLKVGDEIELQPTALRGRIRTLQSYKQSVEIAQPGSRVAVNLSGIEKSEIQRGHVLTYPRQLQATRLADVRFRHLPDASRPLKHNAEVKVFSGAAESMARVRLLDDQTLPPGQEGWLQIRLESELPLLQGDRFIIRYPSPPETIGGGTIINPNPGRRWKRFQPDVIEQLELRLMGSPAERLAQAAAHNDGVNQQTLQTQLGLSDQQLQAAIQEALDQHLLVQVTPRQFMSASHWIALRDQISQTLVDFHQKYPLRQGMQREQMRSQLGIKSQTLNTLLEAWADIQSTEDLIQLADHEIRFSPAEQAVVDQLMSIMANNFAPPSLTEASEITGEAVLMALIEHGELVRIQPDIIFSSADYKQMVDAVLEMIDQRGNVSAGELRDRFQTTRKYAIGLLEHLDNIKVTRRQDDVRVRGPRA
jgi:selenocysteine-specific elongation factor